MIKRLASRELKTKFGTFTEILYYDGQKESIALVMGDVSGDAARTFSPAIAAGLAGRVADLFTPAR